MTSIQVIALLVTISGAMMSLILGIILHRKLAVMVGAIFLMSIGLIVIMGYLANAPQIYTLPSQGIGMALPTGICFFVTGGCLLILVNEINFK